MYEEILKLIEKGELDKAQELINETPENDPKRYNISGLIYYQKKEFDKAKEEFEKGLKTTLQEINSSNKVYEVIHSLKTS